MKRVTENTESSQTLDLCDRYWCNGNLKIHIKHHKKRERDCNSCTKSSKNLKGIKIHIQNAHRISCKSCNNKFKEKADWKFHMKKVHVVSCGGLCLKKRMI